MRQQPTLRAADESVGWTRGPYLYCSDRPLASLSEDGGFLRRRRAKAWTTSEVNLRRKANTHRSILHRAEPGATASVSASGRLRDLSLINDPAVAARSLRIPEGQHKRLWRDAFALAGRMPAEDVVFPQKSLLTQRHDKDALRRFGAQRGQERGPRLRSRRNAPRSKYRSILDGALSHEEHQEIWRRTHLVDAWHELREARGKDEQTTQRRLVGEGGGRRPRVC